MVHPKRYPGENSGEDSGPVDVQKVAGDVPLDLELHHQTHVGTCVEIHLLASNDLPQEIELRDIQLLSHLDAILIVFPG